jgi:hypothetical protein
MDLTREYWTNIIEKTTGQEIMMNTSDCVIYKTGKDNCIGCQYELNCAKLSGIMAVVYSMSHYKPRDFSDHFRTEQQAAILIDQIMNASSVEEINKIIGEEKE